MKNLDKEEFRVKLEEINHLVEQKDYKGAMNVVDSIDWRRVKNVRTLCVVGEIYAANKRYEDSKEIFLLAYHRASIGKNILYRLVEVSLKLGQVSEAVEFYQEYREVAPNDNTQYILKYKILKVKKAPLAEQIKVLEDYKEKEFTEKWSYELAKLYYQDGDKEKCLELCNEIILWFNEGNYVMKAMDLKQRMGALTGAEKERYEQQFVPKLLKPEEADTIKEEEKAPEAENQGSESIESIQIKSEDLDGVESLQDKISKGLRDIFGSRKMDEMEDSIVSTEQTKEVQEEMLRDPASEKEYESVPELEPETGKVKVENTKENVAEESVSTADETAEESAEAVSEENTEGLENADRSESAEEKNAFSTETETPVENLKMPTLNIPDSMKNMVPEEIEVPKAPVQNNLFSDEADAAEKMKDEKPAFDFSNFNLEDTILAAASAQGIEIPDEKVDEEKVQEENKEIVEVAKEISTQPQKAVKEEKVAEKSVEYTKEFEEMYMQLFGTKPVKGEKYESKIDDSNKIDDIAKLENRTVFENLEEYQKPTYKFVGILFDEYIIIEMEKEMYIIDQHAAHEKILFEKLKDNYYDTENKDSQLMLLPDIITLSRKQMEIARDNMQMFRNAGFMVEEFGENTVKITGVPEICLELETREIFTQILDEIDKVSRNEKQEVEQKFISTLALKIAKDASIANTKEEVDGLMNELLILNNPFIGPLGEPIAIKMSKYDIERKFARK